MPKLRKQEEPTCRRTRKEDSAKKIKNLKLKFSRMLTCYGSICYIVSNNGNVDSVDILKMSQLSPMERLKHSAKDISELSKNIANVEKEYDWFLELTNVSEEELNLKFSNKSLRKKAFDRAGVFGDNIFVITKAVAEDSDFLRYLLV